MLQTPKFDAGFGPMHLIRLIAVTAFAIAFVSRPVEAQTTTPSDVWMDQFLSAYSDGTPEAFEHFCVSEYQMDPQVAPERSRASCGGYLFRLRARYGSLSVRYIEERPIGRVHWLESDASHAVIGVRFQPTENNPPRIDGVMLYQDVYPVGFPPAEPIRRGDESRQLRRYFDTLERQHLFAGVVLVARGDRVLFNRAYGLADTATGREINEATPFRIGSIGKMLTAVAVLNLVRQHRIDLDAPIATYLPSYPARVADQVTARHLLTHTSGIELDDYEPFLRAVDQAESLEAIIAAQTLYIEHLNEGRYADFHPLNSFDYSNEEYDLLGAILQSVTGRPWDEAVRDLVLTPAAARDVWFTPPPRAAVGYTLRDSDGSWGYDLHQSTDLLRSLARPAGSEFATAAALFRFMRYVERNRASALFDAATTAQIDQGESFGVQSGYGLGFETERHACYRAYGHGGVEAGVSAVGRYYPESQLTIIVLSNRDGQAFDAARFVERSLVPRCPAA